MSRGELQSVVQAVKDMSVLLHEGCKDQDALVLVKYIAEEDRLEKLLENQQVFWTPI